MSHPPFRLARADAKGPFVIVCDHATNFVPPELSQLGLPDSELARHIGWDAGAAAIAEILSERFDSPAVFCGTSRLVIDCNRQLEAFDLIPEVSDGVPVPGNNDLSEADRQARIVTYFEPYHLAIEKIIAAGGDRIFLSVHSMTDKMKNKIRPWPISMSSFTDRTLVDPLLAALRSSNEFLVGDNEPYNIDPKVDYSTPHHAIRRGLPHLQVEFRQDEIGSNEGQRLWAGRFGDALEKAGFLGPGLRFDDVNYLVAGATAGAAVDFIFFTCFLAVFLVDVAEGAGVVPFCTFFAAGAAIRKGTATIVIRVELINLFILFLL